MVEEAGGQRRFFLGSYWITLHTIIDGDIYNYDADAIWCFFALYKSFDGDPLRSTFSQAS